MIFKNEVFELEGAPHRLLDVDHEGNTAWVIALQDDKVRIPLMADSHSIPIADSVPCDGGHAARVS